MSDRQTGAVRRHASTPDGEEERFNKALGVNLRQARQEAGLTQDALAARAQLTRGSIANIERGDQTPGLYRLLVLCSALDCRLDDVLPTLSSDVDGVAEVLGDKYQSIVRDVQVRAARKRTQPKASG